jgi:hypothetical protein
MNQSIAKNINIDITFVDNNITFLILVFAYRLMIGSFRIAAEFYVKKSHTQNNTQKNVIRMLLLIPNLATGALLQQLPQDWAVTPDICYQYLRTECLRPGGYNARTDR